MSSCLAGLLGAVIGDMTVRNVGIVGYAVVLPVVMLLIGRLLAAGQPPGTGPWPPGSR